MVDVSSVPEATNTFIVSVDTVFKIISVLGTVIGGLCLVMFRKMNGDIGNASRRAEKVENDLAAHKIYASENFAKEVNVQASLSRIHERLDTLGNNISIQIAQVNTNVINAIRGNRHNE